MNKKNIAKYMITHRDDIESLVKSREHQELYMKYLNDLADLMRNNESLKSAHGDENLQSEIKATMIQYFFKNWVTSAILKLW